MSLNNLHKCTALSYGKYLSDLHQKSNHKNISTHHDALMNLQILGSFDQIMKCQNHLFFHLNLL